MKWSDFVAPCTVKSAGSASGWFDRIIGRTPAKDLGPNGKYVFLPIPKEDLRTTAKPNMLEPLGN